MARYLKVPIKFLAGSTIVYDYYITVPVLTQEEYNLFYSALPTARTLITAPNLSLVPYMEYALNEKETVLVNIHFNAAYETLAAFITGAETLDQEQFAEQFPITETTSDGRKQWRKRAFTLRVGSESIEGTANSLYILNTSGTSYTFHSIGDISIVSGQSIFLASLFYNLARLNTAGLGNVNSDPATEINDLRATNATIYPLVMCEDSSGTIIDGTRVEFYVGGIPQTSTGNNRFVRWGWANTGSAKNDTIIFLNTDPEVVPYIPPEEQDTPYFPENPTDPSQQPTEPQIGPTPGEWILHEDYIPRLPSPNNDLGLGIMRAYSMTKDQLTGFSNALWSENILTVMKTMLANPLDVVISLMSFPFEIRNYSAAENIQFAWLSQWIPGSCNGNPLTSEIQVINFGQIEVKRYSGTFYDYEPYSTCTLYLPYIGYVTLKVNEILGKTLRLQYIVNLLTGNFTAIIDVDGNPQIISQFQGVIGRPLPLSSGDFYNIVQTTAKIAEGFATGGVAGAAVGLGGAVAGLLASTPQSSGTAIGPAIPQTGGEEEGGAGLKQAASLMSKGRKIATFTANAMESVAAASGSIQRAGSIGPVSGRTSTQDAYIILTLPHQNVPENQALLGYPTNLPGPLANYKGYTEVRSIELQADGATDGELAELQDILQGGIVITE